MAGISIAKSVDYLMLQPNTTKGDVEAGCQLAAGAHLASVQVFPAHVVTAAAALRGSDSKVCAAIGFPFGQDSLPAKLVAMEQAISDGAEEMAVMLCHSDVLEHDLERLCHEVDSICSSVLWAALRSARGRAQLTLVIETMHADLARFTRLFEMLSDSPFGFVQTSAGHLARAVTADHVERLRQLLPSDVAIRAVGGITRYSDAEDLLVAGAVRIGSAAAIEIVREEKELSATS